MASELSRSTKQYFIDLVDYLFENGGDFEHQCAEATAAAARAGMSEDEMRWAMGERWGDLVEIALEDGELSRSEETGLAGIRSVFSLDGFIINETEQLRRLTKLAIIRGLKDGAPQQRVDCKVPFKLQKSEVLLWTSNDVALRETVKKSSIRGGSLGLSIKVARGIYIRPSAFAAAPHVIEEEKITDSGDVYLMTKHIVFSGQQKSFRVRFNSLALIEPFSDALMIQKNTATARPMTLHPLDGWFYYNAIQNS